MFDISIELIVALSVAVAATIMGLVKAIEVVSLSRSKVAKLQANKNSQVDRLRRAARASLTFKRSVRDTRRRVEGAELELEEAEAKFRAAEAIDHRLYVLDDRRTKLDRNWVALVMHGGYAQAINSHATAEAVDSWQRGRRYLVFAIDEIKARDKVLTRYPERLGYRVMSLTLQEPPKVKGAKGKAAAEKASS